jgi:hypothetical protein
MGLEIIVRPSLPNAKRPVAKQSAAVDDAPFTMDGGSTSATELSHSRSVSYSNQLNREVRRVYDVVRVKNPDDEDQHVDVEVTRGMVLANGLGGINKLKLSKPPTADNIEVLESLKTRDS